ncbi:hypothetical protein G7054_g7075 [Neopestalotiopsis clavispora]|nr:hypothetical protein G7054_g7075 [Neopestalotiopsis clavispora]
MLAVEEFPVLPIVKAHFIFNCVLTSLAICVVGLRVYTRLAYKTGLGWDDALILISAPQGVGMLIIQGLWLPMGIGYPLTEVAVNIGVILRLLVAYELIYATSISSIKLSVLCFYLRMFVNPGLKKVTKYVIAFVLLWSVGNILQVFLICRPFAATYDPTVPGTCGDQVGSFIAIGAFNIITDVLIFFLPIHTIWTLQMKTRAKIGVVAVFLIGILTSIVGICRIVSLLNVDLTNNLTGTMIYADFLSTIEPNLAVLCVSLPVLGPLLSCLRSRNRRTGYESNQRTGDRGESGTTSFGGKNKQHDSFIKLRDMGGETSSNFSAQHRAES